MDNQYLEAMFELSRNPVGDKRIKILDFCQTPKTRAEISKHIGINRRNCQDYLKFMVEGRYLIIDDFLKGSYYYLATVSKHDWKNTES